MTTNMRKDFQKLIDKVMQSLDWDTIYEVNKVFKFGVGGGSEQSETTPVIACIGVARRELCNIKKGRGFAVVQRTGRRNRWHWRAIHIWNEHGAAGEWPGDCFATARCHGLSGILPRAAGGLRARSDCRTEHCRSTTCDGRAAGDQTGFVR